MINIKNVMSYCSNYEGIENYQEAISSPEKWDCHHRLEDTGLSRKNLIDKGMYYDRPADELIFLTRRAHISLHHKGKESPMWGKRHSKETKNKISEANKGRILSDETKQKMSRNHADFSGSKNPGYKFICPIKLTYMYCKQEMSANAIARELDADVKTILRKLRELNIPIRKR